MSSTTPEATSLAVEWRHLASIDSTSRFLRSELEAGSLRGPVCLVADTQSGGIGRFGRPWVSPPGGLWCTLAAPIGPGQAAVLTGLGLRVGIACTLGVRDLVPAEVRPRIRLKWPNDVVIGGLKLLGVLTEIVRAGAAEDQPPGSGAEPTTWVLIGLGLNANFPADRLPPALAGAATTLRTALGRDIDLAAAAGHLVSRLTGALAQPGLSASLIGQARDLLDGVGRPGLLSLPTGDKLRASLVGLDRDGHPVFEQDGSRWPAPDAVTVASV